MHLGNGALTPECAALTWGVAAVGLGVAGYELRRNRLTREQMLAAAALSAAVCAAQMLNVQALPLALSGHLVGGVLLAWVLGPAAGAVAMGLILAVQALLLGDGGWVAWGANTINMGLLPAGMVWAARRALAEESSPLARGATLCGLSIAAVIAAAGLIVGEVAIGRGGNELAGLPAFATQMVGVHAWLGLAEGLVTLGLVALLAPLALPGEYRLDASRLAAIGAAAVGLLLLAAFVSSPLPDGYEATAAASEWNSLLAKEPTELVSVGTLNAQAGAWQQQVVSGIGAVLPSELALAFVAMTLAAGLMLGATALSSVGRMDEVASVK